MNEKKSKNRIDKENFLKKSNKKTCKKEKKKKKKKKKKEKKERKKERVSQLNCPKIFKSTPFFRHIYFSRPPKMPKKREDYFYAARGKRRVFFFYFFFYTCSFLNSTFIFLPYTHFTPQKKNKSQEQSLISADRRTKPTLMLTILCPKLSRLQRICTT